MYCLYARSLLRWLIGIKSGKAWWEFPSLSSRLHVVIADVLCAFDATRGEGGEKNIIVVKNAPFLTWDTTTHPHGCLINWISEWATNESWRLYFPDGCKEKRYLPHDCVRVRPFCICAAPEGKRGGGLCVFIWPLSPLTPKSAEPSISGIRDI